MMVTTHAAVGALIGRYTRTPTQAALLGAASHLLLDSLPHWGTTDRQAFLRVARIDGLTMLCVTALLLTTAPPEHRRGVSAGIAGSVAPDLDKPVAHFFGRNLFPRPVRQLLVRVQIGREKPHRLTYETLIAICATVLASSELRTRTGADCRTVRSSVRPPASNALRHGPSRYGM